nr:sensor domain-containing diguanylate cyclase [uncultured Pseudomonas sp.]
MLRLFPTARQRPLILLILVLLGCGFITTSLVSYYSALDSIRASIVNTELPLTSDNVYSEIQKDLIRPILISSMMSRDTYMRDWAIAGEGDVGQITRYLQEVQEHYGTVTSFFISEQSRTYYQAKGVLKQIDKAEPRDAWYFRVRDMQAPYEINVDVDMANQDRLTVFINYKVFDYQHRFIGATGVGLTVDDVVELIDTYQQRYNRSVFFVDPSGHVVLTGTSGGAMGAKAGQTLGELPGLSSLMPQSEPQSGNFQYQENGRNHFLNVRFIPELNWYLFVDKHENGALAGIRTSLYLNLLVCLLVTAIVVTIVGVALRRYQARITALATTDQLTELLNRRGFDLLANQALQETRRNQGELCALLLDLDNFKELNDTHGHQAGDQVLRGFAHNLRDDLRQSDILCRWGGEEFVLLLKDTSVEQARVLAQKIRRQTEQSEFHYNGSALHITTSIGLAQLHAEESLEQLLLRADRALYRAKQGGRNRLCEEQS